MTNATGLNTDALTIIARELADLVKCFDVADRDLTAFPADPARRSHRDALESRILGIEDAIASLRASTLPGVALQLRYLRALLLIDDEEARAKALRLASSALAAVDSLAGLEPGDLAGDYFGWRAA